MITESSLERLVAGFLSSVAQATDELGKEISNNDFGFYDFFGSDFSDLLIGSVTMFVAAKHLNKLSDNKVLDSSDAYRLAVDSLQTFMRTGTFSNSFLKCKLVKSVLEGKK